MNYLQNYRRNLLFVSNILVSTFFSYVSKFKCSQFSKRQNPKDPICSHWSYLIIPAISYCHIPPPTPAPQLIPWTVSSTKNIRSFLWTFVQFEQHLNICSIYFHSLGYLFLPSDFQVQMIIPGLGTYYLHLHKHLLCLLLFPYFCVLFCIWQPTHGEGNSSLHFKWV